MPNKPSLALISLGCDKNLVESERILGALSNGVFIVSDVNAADIVIINTCGFIQAAVDEAHEQINEVLNQRKLNAHVIVTGCFVQRFLHDLPPQYPDIHAFVADFAEVQKAVADLVGGTWNEGQWRVLSTPSHYAYLKIAEGCDNCCTYCTIPLIKGGLKSVPMDELLSEAAALAATGVKELILIAQDTAVYGRDIYGESRLPHLLQELAKIPAIKWLRLMYCYPEHISDGLVEEIAANPKVCKYLDMPIQHSSSSVLDRMGRKMDESGLRGLITRLRTRIPGIALRTTVITGFPGETKEEYRSLLSFLKEIKFDRLGAFTYSRENGTVAADMPDQLNENVKSTRLDRIMQEQGTITSEKLRSYVGTVLEVLLESLRDDGSYIGRSYMDSPEVDGLVFVESAQELEIGSLINVKIVDSDTYDLYGEAIL